MLTNDHLPRDPDVCRDLATYFEAQARALREHARGLEAAELFNWRKTMKVWRSGKLARAFIENGMPEGLAVASTARQLLLEERTVAAQLRFQRIKAQARAADRRNNEILRLARRGYSLRIISQRLGLSKSRVQQIIKLNP